MTRRLFLPACAALVSFLTGCGSGPQFTEVDGTITQGGVFTRGATARFQYVLVVQRGP